jgi:hypothetical protein
MRAQLQCWIGLDGRGITPECQSSTESPPFVAASPRHRFLCMFLPRDPSRQHKRPGPDSISARGGTCAGCHGLSKIERPSQILASRRAHISGSDLGRCEPRDFLCDVHIPSIRFGFSCRPSAKSRSSKLGVCPLFLEFSITNHQCWNHSARARRRWIRLPSQIHPAIQPRH